MKASEIENDLIDDHTGIHGDEAECVPAGIELGQCEPRKELEMTGINFLPQTVSSSPGGIIRILLGEFFISKSTRL